MSVFSECLNNVKERRGLTSAQIADVINVECSVIYRWIKGERLPNSWNKIHELAEKLKLSSEEIIELKKTYEQSVIGDEKYRVFQKILEVVDVLQKRKEEYRGDVNYATFMSIQQNRELPQTLVLNNNLEVLQCIQNLFDYLVFKDNKRLYIKMQKNISELKMFIKIFLAKVENCYLEEVVCISGEKDKQDYCLETLKNAIEVIAQKNEVKVYYGEMTENMRGFMGNYMMSDDFFVQFDNDLSFGFMTTEPEMINFYKKNYNTIKDNCSVLYNKSESPMEYIERNIGRNSIDIYGMEYMPCMGVVLPEDLLWKFLYDFPEKENFIQILSNMSNVIMGNNTKIIETAKTFFMREGLIKFMETGRFEVFPYDIYRELDIEARCRVLSNTIKAIEFGKVEQYMLREESMLDCKGLHIEYDKTVNELYIETHFANKSVEVLTINNKNICKQFGDFFAYLKESDNVYSKEDTLKHMKEILRRYQQSN